MKEIESPIVVADAPFDFILLGPEQEVLVQSGDTDVFLLGAANAPAAATQSPQQSWIEFVFQISIPKVHGVRSRVIRGLYDDDPNVTIYTVTADSLIDNSPDARAVGFIFVWTGTIPVADLEQIELYFANCVTAVYRALSDKNPTESVRKHLAPLFVLCVQATRAIRRNGLKANTSDGREFRRELARTMNLLNSLALFAGVICCVLSILTIAGLNSLAIQAGIAGSIASCLALVGMMNYRPR